MMKYFTMDPDKIEALITDKTSAIIPVHVYGNFCDVERIEQIAKKHNLKVIYDAAHTFGAEYKGKSAAAYGDASIYSFHATKVFNTIEGGAVAFGEPWMGHRLNCLKNFGIVDQEHVVWVGGNAKMNEFQAAMGICNLRHVNGEIEKRRHVAERSVMSESIGNGLEEQIESFKIEHCGLKIVFIDTLQMVRGSTDSSYGSDYKDLSVLKALADKLEITVIVVHHTRKCKDIDPFNMISGSTGISGCVDGSLVLIENKRGSRNAKLYCVGRDIENAEINLQFDSDLKKWVVTDEPSAPKK